jgi:hypothetical protein
MSEVIAETQDITTTDEVDFSQATISNETSFADVDLSVLSQDPLIKQLGGIVIKSGRIFKAGDFPDKKFKATRKDIANACDKFTKPVPLDVEHLPSLFDGRLGYLIGITQDPKDPDWMLGTTAVTKAASDLLGDRPLPVSVVWDKPTMTITRTALTANPRVEDAAVMSSAQFSKEEIDEQTEQLARFIGARHNTTDFNALKLVHDTIASMADGVCSPPADKETQTMSDVTNANNAGTATQDIAEFKAELAKMQALVAAQTAQLTQQSSQLVTMASERRKAEAVSFSTEAVRTGKVVPAAQSYLSALYEQALKDDENADKPDTTVVFSVKKGKTVEQQAVTMSSRAAIIKDLITNLPVNGLDVELAKTNGQVLFGTSGKDSAHQEPDGDESDFAKKNGFSKAEYIKNMNATPQGKAALAKMRASKTGIFADDMDETA